MISPAEHEANTRLIAATPEMAALLTEFAAPLFVNYRTEGPEPENVCGVCEQTIQVTMNAQGGEVQEHGHVSDCAVLRTRDLLTRIEGASK